MLEIVAKHRTFKSIMFGVFPISLLMLLYIVSVRITTATFFVVLHNFFDIVKVMQLFLPNSIVETVSIGLGGYLDAALYPESRAFGMYYLIYFLTQGIRISSQQVCQQ